MGGPGSGNRRRHSVKCTVTGYSTLDVRRLARTGGLRPGYNGGWQWICDGKTVGSIQLSTEGDQVVLDYWHGREGEEWKAVHISVHIVRTPCNLGGSRAWFRCPSVGCSRRVAILYGKGIFACRHCHELAYPSTRVGPMDCATARLSKLRMRLGWQPGFLNGNGCKPKWMRWATFNKLVREHEDLVGGSLSAMARHLGVADRQSTSGQRGRDQ